MRDNQSLARANKSLQRKLDLAEREMAERGKELERINFILDRYELPLCDAGLDYIHTAIADVLEKYVDRSPHRSGRKKYVRN